MKHSATLVFLGPSLPQQQAQEILPDALYLPPIKCGDVLRCLRLRPHALLIIDGVFERTAAVWHKEILFAMEQGVTVMGAASMGALRAAELNAYGMEGVGQIYQHYASGQWRDDDEVAVLHGDATTEYQAITDSMANIRATLASAHAQNVIDDDALHMLLTLAKNTFYPQRLLINLCMQISERPIQSQMDRLVTWIRDGGYVDQKAQDAQALLQHAKQRGKLATTSTLHTPRSIYFRTLQRSILCQPFITYRQELPMQEKVALAARLFGKKYVLLQRLSHLLAMAYSLAKQKVGPMNQKIYGLGSLVFNRQWQGNNDCLDIALVSFVERLQYISNYLQKHSPPKQSCEDYLVPLMQLSGDYIRCKASIVLTESQRKNKAATLAVFEQQDPEKYRLMYYIADIFRVIDHQAKQAGMIPQPMDLRQYVIKFRLNHGLNRDQDMKNWLTENDVTHDEFQSLMGLSLRFDFLVVGNNADAIGGFMENDDNWWFLDALRLTNLYYSAKLLYLDSARCNAFLKQWHREHSPTDYAHRYDFSQGAQELTQFMAMLAEQA